MQKVFAAEIGPYLDGSMVVEQACEILGLHVPGMRPVSHDVLMEGRQFYPIRDLSGDTTFWDRSIYTTMTGIPDIFAGLPSLGRPYVIIERNRHDNKYQPVDSLTDAFGRQAHIGFDPVPSAIDKMSRGFDPERRQELFSALLRVDFFYFGSKWMGRNYGFQMSEARKIRLSLECPTAPGPQRKAAEEVVEAIRSRVGTLVDFIDVKTRAVVRQGEVWYSREERDWCLASPNRIFGFSYETIGPGEDLDLAVRPAAEGLPTQG